MHFAPRLVEADLSHLREDILIHGFENGILATATRGDAELQSVGTASGGGLCRIDMFVARQVIVAIDLQKQSIEVLFDERQGGGIAAGGVVS